MSALAEGVVAVTMSTLKPLLVVACSCARYFNREETKAERVKQSIADVEMILAQLGLPDASKPAAK